MNREDSEVSLSGLPTTHVWRGMLQGEPEPWSESKGSGLMLGLEKVRDSLLMMEKC